MRMGGLSCGAGTASLESRSFERSPMGKRAVCLVPLAVLVHLSCSRESTSPDWSIEALRVEHLEAPLGLDEPAPRFTWRLASEARGEKQSAYRILVSRSGETA